MQGRSPADVSLPVTALQPGRARGPLRFVPVSDDSRHVEPEHAVWAVRSGADFPSSDPNRHPSGVIACSADRVPLGLATELPAVQGVEEGLLRDGERVALDGTEGTLEIEGVREVPVVTAFIERADGRLLLLQRSLEVGSFRGRWAAVSGFLEEPSPERQAAREVEEETGIPSASLTPAGSGAPVLSRDENRVYIVHPFRFRTKTTTVRLNWENSAFEWVRPEEIDHRPTVPNLATAWKRVGPSVREKP